MAVLPEIYYGSAIGKAVFDPPYTPAEARVLLHLHDLGKKTIQNLEWEISVLVTEQQEEAFRQGVRLGFRLASEILAIAPEG